MLGLFAFAVLASCMIWLMARSARRRASPARRGADGGVYGGGGGDGGGHASSCGDGGGGGGACGDGGGGGGGDG